MADTLTRENDDTGPRYATLKATPKRPSSTSSGQPSRSSSLLQLPSSGGKLIDSGDDRIAIDIVPSHMDYPDLSKKAKGNIQKAGRSLLGLFTPLG